MCLLAFLILLTATVPSVAEAQTFAPSTMNPAQLLQKATEAQGQLHMRAFREIEETTNGDRKILTETLVDGDDYVETVHDGPNTESSGRWHGSHWERNANGVVIHMTDYNLTANPFRQVLQAPETASSNMRVLGVTSDASPSVVLEIDPRDALVQRRYYDAKTYLLRRIETKTYDGYTKVSEYDDYQRFEGRLIARTSRYHDGRPENDATSTLTSIEPLHDVDVSKFAIPASAKPFAASGTASIEIPATFTSDGIVVRLNVAGRGLDFKLDSGAYQTIIDEGTAKSMGLSFYGRNVATIGGDFRVSSTRLPDVSLGALHAHDLAVEVLPFTQQLGGVKVVGLLGSDFFASGAVTVDMRNWRLSIVPGSAVAPDGYAKLPISIDDYVPFLKASFNGKEGTFVADLGAARSILFPHYFARFNAPGSDESEELRFIGGATKIRSYRFAHVGLGDYDVQDVLVSVPSNRKVEDTNFDGLLGRDLLHFFTLIFDYPNQAIYLKPVATE